MKKNQQNSEALPQGKKKGFLKTKKTQNFPID
jgi:hypothetical protein